MHGLAGVQVEHVADSIAEAQRVGGRIGETTRLKALELDPRDLERALVGTAHARLADLVRGPGAQVGPQALPLAGQEPVTLEIAKAAVVRDDLEAVAHRLPAATGAVPAVRPLSGELADQLRALHRIEGAEPRSYLLLRHGGGLEERRREQVVLAPVDVDELDRGSVALRRAVEPEPGGRTLAGLPAAAQVLDPGAAAVGTLHPRDEARDDLAELLEDHLPVLAGLRQRRGRHSQQQLLIGLAGGEDPDVAERGCGQEAAQEVQGLGADRAPPRRLGLVGSRPALRGPGLHRLEPL